MEQQVVVQPKLTKSQFIEKMTNEFINTKKHYILKGVHPSPLSASKGFFGCKHFSEANRILKELNEKEIDWQIENKEI